MLNRRNLIAGGLALATTFAASNVTAGDVQKVAHDPTEYVSSESAAQLRRAAIEYSISTGGVGVVLHYKPWEGAPDASVIGKKYVELFAERGAEAKYFVHKGKTVGLAVSFIAQSKGFGPMNSKTAIANIGDAIQLNEDAKRLDPILARN